MPLNNTVSVILPGVVIAVAAIVVFLADLFLKRKGALAWIAVGRPALRRGRGHRPVG